jgi:hypothetical protein
MPADNPERAAEDAAKTIAQQFTVAKLFANMSTEDKMIFYRALNDWFRYERGRA